MRDLRDKIENLSYSVERASNLVLSMANMIFYNERINNKQVSDSLEVISSNLMDLSNELITVWKELPNND